MDVENNTDNKNSGVIDKRLQRRRLLKTGLLAAPIAMTLHGGVPLAHADSSGSCILELIDIANNQNHPRTGELQVPINSKNGHIARKRRSHQGDHDAVPDVNDYRRHTVLMPFDGSREHWKFISSSSNRFGFSCVSSVTNMKHKGKKRHGGNNNP